MRVFVTGSADGLGRAAAKALMDDGHEVVVHVRGIGLVLGQQALHHDAHDAGSS
jgi:NAD(P)-dependent dehydrogenase (short-subunit alcohol dehydrogenase family)